MSEHRAPDGWTEMTVSQVTTRHFSGPSPTCEERNMASGDEWGLLKTTAVTWAGWNAAAHKVPPRAYWGNKNIEVRRGDMLITKAGPRHRVGVVARVTDTPAHLMVSGKMVGLTPDEALVLPQVLAGVLSTRGPQKHLDKRTTGMAESQVNFTNEVLLSTPISIPSMTEQRRIAEILDTVDEAIRSTEHLIAKLGQTKQGLIHDVLARGLDLTFNARDHVHAAAAVTDSVGNVWPSRWPRRSLASCVDPARPITYGIVQAGPDIADGVSYVRTVDLDGLVIGSLLRTSNAIANTYRRSMIKSGDVICGIRATVGKFQTVPDELDGANISRGIARLAPASDVMGEFLCIVLNSTRGRRVIAHTLKGSTFLELTLRQLGDLEISLPPLSEQLEIVRAVAALERRASTEAQQLDKLRQLKQGLMDDLLTGRVRVGTPG